MNTLETGKTNELDTCVNMDQFYKPMSSKTKHVAKKCRVRYPLYKT